MASEDLQVEVEVARVEALEEALGYRFTERDHLIQALTHASFTNEAPTEDGDNERLEFLGDAVLELAVSDILFTRYPDLPEGRLTQLRARVVNTRSLAQVARALKLGASLRLGIGEARTGGRERRSILADAIEAVLGAVYLDGGFVKARDAVAKLLGGRLAQLEEAPLKDAKSRLQEWAQEHHRVTPTYAIVAVEGPEHASEFVAEVLLAGEVLARGVGRSKKDAHQRAAEAALAEVARVEGA